MCDLHSWVIFACLLWWFCRWSWCCWCSIDNLWGTVPITNGSRIFRFLPKPTKTLNSRTYETFTKLDLIVGSHWGILSFSFIHWYKPLFAILAPSNKKKKNSVKTRHFQGCVVLPSINTTSKLLTNTPSRRYQYHSSGFVVNFKQVSQVILRLQLSLNDHLLLTIIIIFKFPPFLMLSLQATFNLLFRLTYISVVLYAHEKIINHKQKHLNNLIKFCLSSLTLPLLSPNDFEPILHKERSRRDKLLPYYSPVDSKKLNVW